MGVEGQDAFGRALKVALLGQPNVGKSSLFSRLTGVGVISSNYPGTTVTFDEGAIVRNGRTVVVKDLPGTYSVSGNSDDERVVVMSLIEDRYDCVVLVAMRHPSSAASSCASRPWSSGYLRSSH